MRNAILSLAALATVLTLPTGVLAQGGPPVAPFAGGKKVTTEEALKEAPKDDPGLVPMAKKVTAAEAKLKKSPKDANAKKAYVEVGYSYAHTIMMDRGKLKPPIQYRAALAMYRRVLKVDPKYQPALSDKKMIEDIYATMPGGIPK